MMVENISTARTVKIHEPNLAKVEVSNAPPQQRKPEQNTEPEVKISQAILDDVEQDIQLMRNVGLQFSVHDATGRTMIRVIDKGTEDLIREIPPEEFLNMAAKLDEMIGILFDKKV